MADDIQIKQFQIADTEALLFFLQIAYPDEPRKSEDSFWRWHFLENPNAPIEDIPLWIAKDGEEIVGQLATIPVTLKVGEKETRAIWILDFIVHTDYRGKGLGKRLVLAAKEYCSTMITLGINEHSSAVFRSLQWTAVGGIHRYHKLLFPGNALGEIAKYELVRSIANFIYTLFRRGMVDSSQNKNVFVHPVTSFDNTFEDLWKRASLQWPCAVVRDQSYLEWQFIKQPGKKFQILGAYERDRLVGYVVLFFRKPEYGDAPPKVAITDIVYDAASSYDVIDVLLKAAIHLALERRAGSLVTDVLDERVEKQLKDLGFWRIKAAPQFMASTNEHEDLIYDSHNWFLTRADSDVSIFELPNV